MSTIKTLLLSLLTLLSYSLFAQINYKEFKSKCLEGNCKNGEGKLKMIIDDKRNNYYIYSGTFVDKQLNGIGELELYENDIKLFSIKGKFLAGIIQKDSISFTTNYGMTSTKGNGFLSGYSTEHGQFYLKGAYMEIKHKEKPEIKYETRSGNFYITPSGEYEYNAKTNNTIYYKNGLIVNMPKLDDTDYSIVFPNTGTTFPCNGYVYTFNSGSYGGIVNSKRVKLYEDLPGNATRGGNYAIYDQNLCMKNGEFVINCADGSRITQMYNNDVLLSSDTINKAKKEELAKAAELRRKLEDETYEASAQGQRDKAARLDYIEKQKAEQDKWKRIEQERKDKKDEERKAAYEASQEKFDPDAIIAKMDKAKCYSCNNGNYKISRLCTAKGCVKGEIKEVTEKTAEYKSHGQGSIGHVEFKERTDKFTCRHCKGTGYYHCADCLRKK